MKLVVYGIKNCDTMKKARAWLDGHGIAYQFHDYKTLGADSKLIARWAEHVGWQVLLNRAGTTFRRLREQDKDGLDTAKAVALMTAQPSLIKRPVVEGGGKLIVGFKSDRYAAEFG